MRGKGDGPLVSEGWAESGIEARLAATLYVCNDGVGDSAQATAHQTQESALSGSM